jgi:transposase
VHLAHPAAIKKYEGLKHSGDFADAAYLAQLLRLGLLAEGYSYPRAERGARDLARKRMQLVRYRTAQILALTSKQKWRLVPGPTPRRRRRSEHNGSRV